MDFYLIEEYYGGGKIVIMELGEIRKKIGEGWKRFEYVVWFF